MRNKLDIFIFIDALGWEVIKNRPFLEKELPYRTSAKMQFGYSCTAIPTILTGVPPTEHKHLSFYYYAPDKSPFKLFKYLGLKYMPSALTDNWRVRHKFSKIVARHYGYSGYFELYSMPFDKIQYFDYIEKTDLFVPGGLAPVPNIADQLVERKIPYHISNWRLSEQENIDALLSDIDKKDISFAFLYTAAMDALLHRVTKDGREITPKLEWYSERIKKVIDKAHKNYKDVSIHVMSDHGMTTLTETVDVKKQVESLPFKFGKDYAATYDSTMGRFWFFNDKARKTICECLMSIPHSNIVSEADKKRFMINFDDNMYGETYLLMDPGVQIVPSHMGIKPLPGMHGFSPDHEDSDASFLSSEPFNNDINWVGDYHKEMLYCMDRLVKIKQ
jgi:predicted AlkP superfamily pyrophosphatase or phosphodiesterase